MGDWFINPLGRDPLAMLGAGRRERKPVEAGQYVCVRCGQPLVPCERCGLPAMCGDVWCEACQPDG